MWTDGDLEELHAMAEKLGLKRDYFQNHIFLPHYDLIPKKRELAIKKGATPVSLKSWIRKKRSCEEPS